ncbi:GntR family transcriptional regulator [Paenibacillus sp. HWE-109]|uniref:GntR family transcriptional regulator n=1 Tax=Paenibacillus sp. HWE-109 TaxID=1306526 RepID=UPI001EDE4DA6|nr:GntR family transcriptional regulator [Paenibacillus sp. HWE-109]UKS30865.1 GntR family transcriptional regulator [Paenibacillus sp. HWE-109]
MSSKISRVNLTEEIYRIVKEDILSHKLKSGEKINIDQLARQLEVSNIPIREALSRLQSEGFIHVIPFKGMFVTMMSLKDLNELYEIRLQLEPLAVEKAALRLPVDILERLQDTMESLHDNPPSAENGLEVVDQMNTSIHGTILAYCDNANLANLVRGYMEQVQRYLSFIQLTLDVDTTKVEWEEHQAILQKLRERDSQGAAEAMSIHLRNSQKRTNELFMRTGVE